MEIDRKRPRLEHIRDRFFIIILLFGSICCIAQEGKLHATIDVVSNRIEKEGSKPEYLKIRGWAYYELGDFGSAINDYKNALAQDPADHELYFRLAEIEYDSGLYGHSIENYSSAIVLAPDSLSYRIARGVTLEKLQLYDEALDDYNFILDRAPTKKQALINRANLFLTLREYEDSIEDWSTLINTYKDPIFYNDRAVVYSEIDMYEKAIKDLNEAIRFDNMNDKFFFNRGYAHGMIGQTRKAFSDFEKALRLDSSNPYLYLLRGKVYLKSDRTRKACDDFRRARHFGLNVEDYIMKCK